MKFKDLPTPLRIEAHQMQLAVTRSTQYEFCYTHGDMSAKIITDKGEPIDGDGVIRAYCGTLLLDENERAQVVIFGTPHFGSTVMPIEVHIIINPMTDMQTILARAIKIASIKRKG